MSKPLRFSDLSPARQTLLRLCQNVDHGSIEDLNVERGEPVFDPAPVLLKDVKLDSDEGPMPELALTDFVVSIEILRLMTLFDEMKSAVNGLRRICSICAAPPAPQSKTRPESTP